MAAFKSCAKQFSSQIYKKSSTGSETKKKKEKEK
jgi:hypothetical protein